MKVEENGGKHQQHSDYIVYFQDGSFMHHSPSPQLEALIFTTVLREGAAPLSVESRQGGA